MAGKDIQHLRDDTVHIGNFQFSREVFLEPNGRLTQEMGIWDEQHEDIIRAGAWQFHTTGDVRQHMQSLDDYWERQRDEFLAMVEHANRYARIKSHGDAESDAFIPHFLLSNMSDILLNQFASDEDIAEGNGAPARTMLVPFSHRYMALREAGHQCQYSIDAYERAMADLNVAVADAIGGYDNIVHGFDAGEQHLRQEDEEHGGYDLPQEPDMGRGGSMLADEDEDDDEDRNAPWRQQDPDHWKQATDDETVEDPDNKRNEQINHIIDRYLDQINHFIENAEATWLEAAQEIRDGRPPHVDTKTIPAMKYWMGEAQESYAQLKDAWQDAGLSAFELAPVHEAIEGEDKGAQAMMQKIISIASHPELLADTIRKGLPRAREL